MQDGEHFREEVPCLDTFNRDRHMQVLVTSAGFVTFQSPPGEVAQVPPSGVQYLQQVITEAHIEAVRVRQG